jgi:hypothetical protein
MSSITREERDGLHNIVNRGVVIARNNSGCEVQPKQTLRLLRYAHNDNTNNEIANFALIILQ